MKCQEYFLIFFFLLIMEAVFIVFQPIAQSQTDFYNNLWTPAQMLAQGKSPYDTASLHPELPALWMPTVVGFFSFLGFFNFNFAQQIWFLLNIAGLGVLIYLSMPESHPLSIMLTGIFSAYFFPSTINHFALGQVSIISALFLFLAVKLTERMPWLSAFLLALGLVKPQIGIFMLFGICVYQFRSSGFKGLFRYGIKVFLAALILCIPLFIAEPNWVSDFIASLQANTPEWTHPSILSQLGIWIGNWKYLLWGLLLLGALWFMGWMWQNNTLHTATLWTLALTVLVTSYVWSWDFVLLLPLFIHMFSRANWKGWILLILGYSLIWAGIAVIQLSENFHNSRFWWVPIGFIGLLAVVELLTNSEKTSRLNE